jgi:uncharacterized protein (TIGR03435 family)
MRSAFFIAMTATVYSAPSALSQSAIGGPPQFEVASVKPFDTRSGVSDAGVSVYPGGRLVIHALPLKSLIAIAFQAGYWQLSGGEDWMEKDVYDIEAKAPRTAAANVYSLRHTRFGIGDERLRQMLQTLLAERFQLKVHRETKIGPVYLLDRSGKAFLPRATKYTEDQPAMGAPGYSGEIEYVGGHWFLFNTSIPQLAKFASDNVLHRPVIDRTEITGSFDYKEANTGVPQEHDFEGSFPSFLRNIGLKLTSATGHVERLVIDHAEKPAPN